MGPRDVFEDFTGDRYVERAVVEGQISDISDNVGAQTWIEVDGHDIQSTRAQNSTYGPAADTDFKQSTAERGCFGYLVPVTE